MLEERLIDAPFAPLLDFIGHLGHNGDAGLHQAHIDVYFYHRLSGDRISTPFPHSLDILGALTQLFTFITNFHLVGRLGLL